MIYKRKYTVTFKATLKSNKGSLELLKEMFNNYLTETAGTAEQFEIEDRNTDNVHIHALVSCPLIKSKSDLAKQFPGWHIHQEIIKYRDYDNIIDIWLKYTNKQLSDSERYLKIYGNMFQ